MKNEMSAFDVLALTAEMRSIIGGFIDKVFHWEANNFLFRINVPGSGRKEIIFQEGRWLYLASERPELPGIPSQLAMTMRKHLSGGRITSVYQKDFDRIVVLEIQRDKKYEVVFEIFGEGNLIVAQEGKIIVALASKQWKHREIRPGVEYKFPPPRFNPISATFESFRAALQASRSDVVRSLATVVNLGGQYAEEICLRAGIDKNRKADSLTDEDFKSLNLALQEIINSIRTKPEPNIVYDDCSPIDVAPIRLIIHAGARSEQFVSFSDAIARFLELKPRSDEEAVDEELQRLQRQLEQQRGAIQELRTRAEECSELAELLFVNYIPINEVLCKFREKAASSKWNEIVEFSKGFDFIKKIDPSEHSIELEIQGRRIRLDYLKSLEENADTLYQESKRLKEKIEGALLAIKETEAKIEQREACRERASFAKDTKKTKEFWFERYKWFITSGGKIVLAGRDAKTNEQLVKKHMTSTDRFVHADIHGAPSVIVKDGATASEEEMVEAGIFALAHSKIWKAGAGEGSAYWVLPDQVSKTPEAGEFVPRGAFIIRGKRNYLHHLPIELAIGEIEYQGERKIMCGPRSAIEKRSTRFIVIVPGDTDRNLISSALAKFFGVPEEEISRVLPPGDISIKEKRNVEIEV
ncbi:MAG: ribosome rescue protein RqcH [Methanomassiliicoccales archaeon]|jgi:predicted ribosome quality control (RQC) complex YloA/Tae2 family protein|nr:ribosome rescue protein RqcH [Methanomassiliicoccales archaeon]